MWFLVTQMSVFAGNTPLYALTYKNGKSLMFGCGRKFVGVCAFLIARGHTVVGVDRRGERQATLSRYEMKQHSIAKNPRGHGDNVTATFDYCTLEYALAMRDGEET